MNTPFSHLLRELLPLPEAQAADYSKAFRQAADLLLNHATLHVAGSPHRLTEIEFYWTGPGHEDPFTHQDPMQLGFGRWYFHKQGNSYKGGTYKGLDIAVGRPDTHAGILVRGMMDLEGQKLLDGSCTCVDHILSRTGRSSVAELAGSFDLSIDESDKERSPLYFTQSKEPGGGAKELFSSPRVGLTLKKGADALRRSFLGRPYRFLTEPSRVKKGRPNLVIALHQEGRSPREIARITGASATQVAKYVKAFEAGKGQDPEQFRKELSTEELCALFGALA